MPASSGSAATGTGAAASTTVPRGTLSASRKALAKLTRLGHSNTPAGRAKNTSIRLGTSQVSASHQVAAARRSFWTATPLSLLIAASIGLVIGTGIVYAGWRNGDLLGRRRSTASS